MRLSNAQIYVVGFLQRGSGYISVNRDVNDASIKPTNGFRFNDITVTIAQVDGLLKRGFIKEKEYEYPIEGQQTYIENPDAKRVPFLLKSDGVYFVPKLEK